MSQDKPSRWLTFFTTMPGVVTAIATLIAAIGGLIVIIDERRDDAPAANQDSAPSAAVASSG